MFFFSSSQFHWKKVFLWWYFVYARSLQISETGLTHHPLFGCWWIAYLGHVSLMNCLNWLKPWWIASDASSKSLWLSEASTSVGDKSCMHELFSLGYVSIPKNMTFLWWEHHPTHRFDDYYIETLRFRTTRWSCTCFKFLRSLNTLATILSKLLQNNYGIVQNLPTMFISVL